VAHLVPATLPAGVLPRIAFPKRTRMI
jgi:hypothetical protein